MAGPLTPASAIPDTAGQDRLQYLDCLRGLAALMVVYLHVSRDSILQLGLSQGLEHGWMYACTFVADFGKIGVVLFFAISGFIIPMSFRPVSRPVRSFVVSRFFRLYPAYWVSLILGLLAAFLLHKEPVSWPVTLSNMTMVQAALGQPDLSGVYWTLFIEWLFYVLCVVAFTAGGLGRTRFSFFTAQILLAMALAGSVVRYETHRKIPVAILVALSIMVWASVWRNYLIDRDSASRRLTIIYLATFLVIFPVISLLAYNFDTGFDETWYRYTVSYLAGLSLFILFTSAYRLNSGILRHIGVISYSLYLLHPLVIDALENIQRNSLPFGSAHLFFAEALALSLLAAEICYRCVERPGIRLAKIIRNRLPAIATPESRSLCTRVVDL